MKNSEI